jgi:amino acid transporter
MTDRTAATRDPSNSRPGRFLVSLILVVLLSLGTWSFFYVKQMPLGSPETSVVVGFWLVVVFGVRWTILLVGRHKRRSAHAERPRIKHAKEG